VKSEISLDTGPDLRFTKHFTVRIQSKSTKFLIVRVQSNPSPVQQRWSESVFLLSDPILFLKNYIRIRSESCFAWNHTIHIRKLSKSILWCTTYNFVLHLFA